jgi:uncharacterized protein YcfJ
MLGLIVTVSRSFTMRHAVPQAAALAALITGAYPIAPAQGAELATVISSTPVATQFPVTRQSCTDAQQVVQPPPSGAGAVVGAIVGGVVGHQFGGGAGQAVATGLGAVAGSMIGNQVEANATPPAAVPVRQCRTVTSYENRVVAYDVVYEYGGQRYSTRMTHDPGSHFEVTVQPADAAGTNLPAPAAEASRPAQPVAYDSPPPVTYESAPAPVYYAPYPAYSPYWGYAPYSYYYPGPGYYAWPAISFGLGYYYGGYHGGYHGGHHGH